MKVPNELTAYKVVKNEPARDNSDRCLIYSVQLKKERRLILIDLLTISVCFVCQFSSICG